MRYDTLRQRAVHSIAVPSRPVAVAGQHNWTEAERAALCYLWATVQGEDTRERCFWVARALGRNSCSVYAMLQRIGLLPCAGRKGAPMPRFEFVPADKPGK